MNKNEIAIASKAFEAGYAKACEDFALAMVRANQESLEKAVRKVAGEGMKRAIADHFDELHKGEKP